MLFPMAALPTFLFAGTAEDFTFEVVLLWLKAGSLPYGRPFPQLVLFLPLGSPFLDSLPGMPDTH